MNENLKCKFELPCVPPILGDHEEKFTPGKNVLSYDCLPRESKFVFMPPSYFATGFRVFPIYKSQIDLSDMKRLFFLEDPNLVDTWGEILKKIPMPIARVTDLPGSRELHYKHYYTRSLMPETTSSWRKSIKLESSCYADLGSKETGPGRKFDCNNPKCPLKG